MLAKECRTGHKLCPPIRATVDWHPIADHILPWSLHQNAETCGRSTNRRQHLPFLFLSALYCFSARDDTLAVR